MTMILVVADKRLLLPQRQLAGVVLMMGVWI